MTKVRDIVRYDMMTKARIKVRRKARNKVKIEKQIKKATPFGVALFFWFNLICGLYLLFGSASFVVGFAYSAFSAELFAFPLIAANITATTASITPAHIPMKFIGYPARFWKVIPALLL